MPNFNCEIFQSQASLGNNCVIPYVDKVNGIQYQNANLIYAISITPSPPNPKPGGYDQSEWHFWNMMMISQMFTAEFCQDAGIQFPVPWYGTDYNFIPLVGQPVFA